jgi:hypothetical protein
MQQQQYESKQHPHREAFEKVQDLADDLRGDMVLVPDADNCDGVGREDLTKISHWSNMEPEDVPRLGVITDSFFRFIDDGEDATVLTLWRNGTPLIQQIDGEPCGPAVDAVMDAVTNMKPLLEKWEGLPPLEAEIERIASRRLYPKGHRPLWIERVARRNLGMDEADNDYAKPEREASSISPEQRLRAAFDGGVLCFDGDTRTHYLAGCWHEGKVGAGIIGPDGEPYFEASADQPDHPSKPRPSACATLPRCQSASGCSVSTIFADTSRRLLARGAVANLLMPFRRRWRWCLAGLYSIPTGRSPSRCGFGM